MNRILGGALALGAALALTTQVNAADLGGGCCTDIEERVAELEATTARKGNRKVSLEVYGQVNAAFLYVETDGGSGQDIIDNRTSESRFGFKGSAKIREGWSAGYVMEIGTGGGFTADDLSVRHSYLYLDTPAGKVSLGRTSQATDDFDGITTANTAHIVRPLQIYGYGIHDGSRDQLVRYDSPTMAGFIFSASSDANDIWDVALRYAGEFGGFRVAAGVGYRNDDAIDLSTMVGALSVMHVESGLFLTGHYGNVDVEFLIPSQNIMGWHLSGGVERKLSDLGKTTLFGEYASLDLDDLTTAEPVLYGLGLNQAIDAAAMDIYLSWRHIDTDSLLGEADLFMAGSRIRF